jgi:hypothetical protein
LAGNAVAGEERLHLVETARSPAAPGWSGAKRSARSSVSIGSSQSRSTNRRSSSTRRSISAPARLR